MIKHVVMWKLGENAGGNDKPTNKSLIIKRLMELKDELTEINTLEVGENFNPSEAAYDLVLITTHENQEALAAYINHPKHREVATFTGSVVEDRKVVDFSY